jgi:hypothetical protein
MTAALLIGKVRLPLSHRAKLAVTRAATHLDHVTTRMNTQRIRRRAGIRAPKKWAAKPVHCHGFSANLSLFFFQHPRASPKVESGKEKKRNRCFVMVKSVTLQGKSSRKTYYSQAEVKGAWGKVSIVRASKPRVAHAIMSLRVFGSY